MAHRIGIDVVDVQGVRDALERFGERYLRRVYTAQEVLDCTWRGEVAPLRLAARFAGKEAAMKVLRPGSAAIPWPSIEVRSRDSGVPDLVLSGAARHRAEQEQLSEFEISITHDGEIASAVVLCLRGERAEDW